MMIFSKPLLFAAISILTTSFSFGQTVSSGFALGVQYGMPRRSTYDRYMQDVADTLLLSGKLQTKQSYGIVLNSCFRFNHTEFEAGIGFSRFFTIAEPASKAYTAKAITHDFTIHIGLNYFPVSFFMLGGELGLNSFGGDLKTQGDMPSVQSLAFVPAGDNLNIFHGYSFCVTPQAGFNIPYGINKDYGIRILAYYHYALSKFNFYTSLDTQLKNYTGPKKTGFAEPGIRLIFFIPRGES